RRQMGFELNEDAIRSLFDVAARKIAYDSATPSPLPDPTKASRLPEFTDWRTGDVRNVMEHAEQIIAGLKETSFPDLPASAPVVDAAPAVVATDTLATAAGVPAVYMPPAEPEVIDLRKATLEASEPAPSAPVASEPAERDWSTPAPARVRRLTAAEEDAL